MYCRLQISPAVLPSKTFESFIYSRFTLTKPKSMDFPGNIYYNRYYTSDKD